jgi:hypothetical protein
MIAFISHSLPDNNGDIVAKLAWKLDDEGFYTLRGHYNGLTDSLNEEATFKIKSAHLFIGILMQTTPLPAPLNTVNKRVINEWEYALSRKIPALLLVENTVQLSTPLTNPNNIVFFDKYHPEKTIVCIKNAMEEARHPVEGDKNNAAAWILGGDSLIKLVQVLVKTVEKGQLIAA